MERAFAGRCTNTFKTLLHRQHSTLHTPAAPLHQKNNFAYGYCEARLLRFDSYLVPWGAFKIFLEEAIYRHGSSCLEESRQPPCPISHATCGWQHYATEGVNVYILRNNNITYFYGTCSSGIMLVSRGCMPPVSASVFTMFPPLCPVSPRFSLTRPL